MGCLSPFPLQPLALPLCEIWSHNSKALESCSIERFARPRVSPRCWRMVLMGAWDAVPCQGGRLGRPMYEKKASGHRQQQYLSYIEGPNPPSWHVTARSSPSMTWQGYICHMADLSPPMPWANTFDAVTFQRLRVVAPDFTQCQWLHGEGSPHAAFGHS